MLLLTRIIDWKLTVTFVSILLKIMSTCEKGRLQDEAPLFPINLLDMFRLVSDRILYHCDQLQHTILVQAQFCK